LQRDLTVGDAPLKVTHDAVLNVQREPPLNVAHPLQTLSLMPGVVAHRISDALKAVGVAERSVELRVEGGGGGVLRARLRGAVKPYRLLGKSLEQLTRPLAPLLR
jgi:hypothetical protein